MSVQSFVEIHQTVVEQSDGPTDTHIDTSSFKDYNFENLRQVKSRCYCMVTRLRSRHTPADCINVLCALVLLCFHQTVSKCE